MVMTHKNLNIGAVQQGLGARLRDARLNLNMTREDLAADIGLSVDTVRNAETGRNVSLETLLRLLCGLGRLGDLDRLLESAGPSPVQLAKRQGKIRQRASGSRTTKKSERWQW
jgi:putative transcriptional regulator